MRTKTSSTRGASSRRTKPAVSAASTAAPDGGYTRVAAPLSAKERQQHGQRIKGLSEFVEYIGKRESDLTMLGRQATPLFHYTSLDGLKGVVENHDLWLTHARYSNDEREITLGLDIAR